MRHRYYIITLLLAVFALLPISSWAQFNWPYTIQDGTIVTEVPVRPAGQQSALGLTVEKIPEKIRANAKNTATTKGIRPVLAPEAIPVNDSM